MATNGPFDLYSNLTFSKFSEVCSLPPGILVVLTFKCDDLSALKKCQKIIKLG